MQTALPRKQMITRNMNGEWENCHRLQKNGTSCIKRGSRLSSIGSMSMVEWYQIIPNCLCISERRMTTSHSQRLKLPVPEFVSWAQPRAKERWRLLCHQRRRQTCQGQSIVTQKTLKIGSNGPKNVGKTTSYLHTLPMCRPRHHIL